MAILTIPPDVLADCRKHAHTLEGKPVNKIAAAVAVLIWLLLAAAAVSLFLRLA